MTGIASFDVVQVRRSHRLVESCMGTVFSIDVRSPGVTTGALAAAVAWLHRADAMFSTYRADSEISRLNRGELQLAECSPDVHEVLALGAQLSGATDGYFTFDDGGSIDPTGLVKGWAIARFSELLSNAGSTNHCVNGGGDVQCVGAPERGKPWLVGIADPFDPSGLAATVAGARFAVATSGTTERGEHIRNPHNGEPAVELVSLTVTGADVMLADVYATAAFAMGHGGLAWLESVVGYEGFAIDRDGYRIATAGFTPS